MTAVFGKSPESKLNLFLSRLLLSAGSARRAPRRRAGTATRGCGRRSGAGRDGRVVGKRKWNRASCRAWGGRSRRWSAAHHGAWRSGAAPLL